MLPAAMRCLLSQQDRTRPVYGLPLPQLQMVNSAEQ